MVTKGGSFFQWSKGPWQNRSCLSRRYILHFMESKASEQDSPELSMPRGYGSGERGHLQRFSDSDEKGYHPSSTDHALEWAANILISLDRVEHGLKRVLGGIPLPLFAIDSRHVVTCWNRACETLTGIPEGDMLGRSDAWRALYPKKRPVLADLIVDHASEKEIAALYEDRFIRSEVIPEMVMAEDFFPGLGPQGIWVFFSASALRNEHGEIIGAIEVLTDITRCKEAERASLENEEKYKQLFEQSAFGIIVADSEYRFLEVNRMALEILGYSREEMLRMSAEELIHPLDQRELTLETSLRRMAAGEISRVERRYRAKNGEYIPVEVNLKRLEGRGPEDHIVMFYDISQRKRAEERADYLSSFDELTGLPNRRLFYKRLHRAAQRCGSGRRGGAVIHLDIDRLSAVNDTLGQEPGDEFIIAVGERLESALDEGDVAARISGGEFMVLSPRTDSAESAHALCRRILDRIGEPHRLSGRIVYPEASLGFTLLPEHPEDPDHIVKQTDIALKGAKKRTIKIQQFREQEDLISREFHLEHDLKRALRNEDFTVFYQPQIGLQSGRTVGLEALIRWRNPEEGFVSPGEFIPLLERTGMIAAVDEWVLREVCQQLRIWRDGGVSLKASVNVSAPEIQDESIVEEVERALEDSGLDSRHLELELTETEIMRNVQQASQVLYRLADRGIRIALDDFGKGYSSLSYLQKLPIRLIKIDKEFVDGVPDSEDAVTLIRTIIDMAHNLGKEVLAEGVERAEQARVLADLGCDYGQGFLWGRPQPPENLILP